ncbi:doublecortin domain-containing protein 1-like isoform X2 [Octopus sinensis]|uniref:Doublecortin domain-containing protein 1-like isoform X2 n=2 Tax=Octopus sinensis TaxID=2607531 RepID=A0A7E6F170_9MOLL|nr:doublecortin domain-containing protein 1-like isoform X2 [Octopus sinensis]
MSRSRSQSASSKDQNDVKIMNHHRVLSYEDLLIANYFEMLNIKRRSHRTDRYRETESLKYDFSPYKQRLSQRPQTQGRTLQPFSDQGSNTVYKNLINTLTDNSKCLRRRPSSAPVKSNRSLSEVHFADPLHHPYRTTKGVRIEKPPKTSQSCIRRQPPIIVVKAYRNGDCNVFTRVAAPDLPMLLELCTKKLQLPFAARIIYLEDGTKVYSPEDIPKEAAIYVSMGEAFQNPQNKNKKSLFDQKNLVWTSFGINLPARKKKKRRNALSNRMRALTVKKNIRIVVFQNGFGSEAVEIVADANKMDEFMNDCTDKLKLRGFARQLYSWEGESVTDLNNIPALSDCLQQSKSLALGPLWVSTGEPFEPSGAMEFLLDMKKVLKRKLKRVKSHRDELVADKSLDKKHQFSSKLPSRGSVEQPEEISKFDSDISDLEDAIATIKSKLEYLKELKQEKMNSENMVQVENSPHLTGRKGLRLKTYENGSMTPCKIFYFNLGEAFKGTNGDQKKLLQRLYDDLSISQRLSNTQKPKIAPNVQKVFLSSGEELKDVLSLKYDQEIWLSFGEAYIDPYTYCMEAIFDKACVQGRAENSRIIRSFKDDDWSDKASQWLAVDNFPVNDSSEFLLPVEDLERNELEKEWHFLQHKNKNDQILYPEVVINYKLPRSDKELWPSDSQIWRVCKNGTIYCKAMPQLCLAVYTDFWIKDQNMPDQEYQISGCVVGLQKKDSYNPNQIWIFNPNGTISAKIYPDLFLTWLGNQLHGSNEEGTNEEINDNTDSMESGNIKPGHNIYLIISEPLPRKLGALQRWAVKQERFDNLGQWKHTQVMNPEWNKLAYSWPVCWDTGTLNEKYDWPMEGYLIPNAPPLSKNSKNNNKLSGMAPIRLMVLKNGERNLSKAVPVVGPNVINMMKALSDKKGANTNSQSRKTNSDGSPQIENRNLHCGSLTVRELEFTMFLDSCTTSLSLPSAARRLFSVTGKELFSLQELKRDQVVYISCHEMWLNPKVTKSEQKRRVLLTNLSSDLTKIRKYCSLRDPINYVLTVNGSLATNSTIIVAPLVVLSSEISEENVLRVSQTVDDAGMSGEVDKEYDQTDVKTHKSCHDISHMYSDIYMNKLKWPWECLVNVENCTNDEEEQNVEEDPASEKHNLKNKVNVPHFTSPEDLQKFTYEDGYIACAESPNLVLTAVQNDSRLADVILMKRSPDDINQRWIIQSDGEIRSRCGHNLVLTVSMPLSSTESQISYIGCSVILKAKKEHKYGEAHQRWYYDADTGYIKAFEAEILNKEITAASSSNICTFAITAKTKIDQPGYSVELPQKPDSLSGQTVLYKKLCLSCAYTLRGRYCMQKLKPGTEFSCAMGDQDKDLESRKLYGSFQVLNGKVDLSTHEALLTLHRWEEKLSNLREETSVHTIGKELSTAQNVKVIKLIAYKNGDGRLHSGHLVIGSTLEGLLSQCTQSLGLTNVARAMYTEDGTQILVIEDLIDVAVQNYKQVLILQVENYIKEKYMKNTEKSTQSPNKANETVELSTAELNQSSLSDAERDDVKETSFAEEDQIDTDEMAKTRDSLMKTVDLPPLSCILRYPIEVWVSSNRRFIPPEVVESKEENRRKKRKIQANIAMELDTHKHILRQLKGRRLEELYPGKYEATQDGTNPVVITGHWTDTTDQEKHHQDKVHQLKNHLDEVNTKENRSHELKTCNVETTKRLYKQSNTKRVLVHPNGENSKEQGTYVYGCSLEEILKEAERKLNLWKSAKYLFFENGQQVESFSDIQRDDVLYVSTGPLFKGVKSEQNDINLKAQWARARRLHGPQITDITVTMEKDPVASQSDKFAKDNTIWGFLKSLDPHHQQQQQYHPKDQPLKTQNHSLN